MAAHLDLTRLRRHALPAHFMFIADRRTGMPMAAAPLPGKAARATVRAEWHVGACGRPVCTWSIDTGDPGLPPA